MSSNVRSDYDAIIVLAGDFPGKQQKHYQTPLLVSKGMLLGSQVSWPPCLVADMLQSANWPSLDTQVA